MEGEIVSVSAKREVVLDTDWLTAVIAAGGMFGLAVFMGVDVWRIVHGTWHKPLAPPLGRIFETIFCCYALFILINCTLKLTDRLLKFSSALMSLGLTLYMVRLWLPTSSSVQFQLSIADNLIEMPAFILLAIYGVKWFRSKVVHV